MSIVCSFVGHSPSAETISNDGYTFSRCSRCRSDLVEMEGKGWIRAPRGYRIVWKRRSASSIGSLAGGENAAPASVSPIQEKRAGRDRRSNAGGPLPAFLGGADRRRAERRKSFGGYRPNRRKSLIARSGDQD